MAIQYDTCPSCGSTVVKGAMRCTSCGALLTSAEEQKQRIERLRESQKKPSPVGAVIKTIVFLVAAGAVWYFFSDRILAFIHSFMGGF